MVVYNAKIHLYTRLRSLCLCRYDEQHILCDIDSTRYGNSYDSNIY